jgi:hypothetical protein
LYGKCRNCYKKPYLCPYLRPVCFHEEGFRANKHNIDRNYSRHRIDWYGVTLVVTFCQRHITSDTLSCTLYSVHMSQNTAQHSKPSEPLSCRLYTVHVCYRTQHNTGTHQNPSAADCKLCTRYRTQHNVLNEPRCFGIV